MNKRRFTEESLVEDYIILQAQERGWSFVDSNALGRDSLEEPLLVANLTRALRKINENIRIGDEEIIQATNELQLRHTGPNDAKQILNLLKFGIPVFFEKERVIKYIKLFDDEKVEKNEFLISRQVFHQNGDKTIRNDIIFYVNGIPLVEVECKNPASFTEDWREAKKQIENYEKTIPELYKYIQIGVAAEQVARYFPIVPWQEGVKSHEWKESGQDSIDSIIEMLSPKKLLGIIQNYLFFKVEYGNATKIIARYMQHRAAEKIFARVTGYVQGTESKNRGLIWHWQGSGKTLTMIFAANKLYHAKTLENPTIFFVVDREELEEQLFQEFVALDIVKPEIITSVHSLKTILQYDEGRGKRGILITLIHKFRQEELEDLQKELDGLSRDNETILTRHNVIGFVDEGHRSQYGLLAAQMKSILKNASFFAFTGTPISKKGKDTYYEFSYPPEEKYEDKYFITDAIEDGFTKKIVYQPRLESQVHLNKQMLEAFLEIEYDEIPEESREKLKGSVKKKLNKIRVILENPERIERIAQDIAEHFEENLDQRFKGMVVAVSREACVRYKQALDRMLPKEYSEIVMTFQRDDSRLIHDYFEELTARYNGKEIGDIRKKIVEDFKTEELPKILIVTDMLLTGFDAPILQTMYLDKPLKEHRLLQAIARTNRPYKDVKEAGVVLDYVGILNEFTRAFKLYSKEETKGALTEIDDLQAQFVSIIDDSLSFFDGVPRDRYDRETMLSAIEVLTTEPSKAKSFLENYKELRKLFELLGSHEVKAKMWSKYSWLSAIFVYYTRLILRSSPTDEINVERYFKKTLKYVYKSTEISDLERSLPIIEFDEHYIRNLETRLKTTEEKAANIVFTLNRFVLVDRHKNPVYESLVEKVERILTLWQEKTKDFEEIYREGRHVIEEVNNLSARQRALNFTDLEYSFLLILEDSIGNGGDKSLIDGVTELSRELKPYMFKDWFYQQTARKHIEREVRRFARRNIIKYQDSRPIKDDIEELYQRLMDSIKIYRKEA